MDRDGNTTYFSLLSQDQNNITIEIIQDNIKTDKILCEDENCCGHHNSSQSVFMNLLKGET